MRTSRRYLSPYGAHPTVGCWRGLRDSLQQAPTNRAHGAAASSQKRMPLSSTTDTYRMAVDGYTGEDAQLRLPPMLFDTKETRYSYQQPVYNEPNTSHRARHNHRHSNERTHAAQAPYTTQNPGKNALNPTGNAPFLV